MAKKRYAQRSKKTYRTARAAWSDIARARGLKPRQVKGAHTRTHWRWKTKRTFDYTAH